MYEVGEVVQHNKYGEGKVIAVGEDRIRISFSGGHCNDFSIKSSNKLLKRYGEFKYYDEENNEWYNLSGFDYKGYDRSGFDKAGFNNNGFHRNGFHIDTYHQYNLQGYNAEGIHMGENIKNAINKKIESHCEMEFDGFYHMTTFANLASILKDGKLASRESSRMITDMISVLPETEDVVFQTDSSVQSSVRLYFRPKTPTFWHFESHDDMVLLKMNIKLVSEKGARVSFGNAGRRSSKIIPVNEKLFDELDVHEIFRSSLQPSTSYEKNCRQTELLIPNEVDIKWIDAVIFKSHDDIRNFKSRYERSVYKNINIEEDPSKFFKGENHGAHLLRGQRVRMHGIERR